MAYGVRELGVVLEGSAACALAAVLVALPRPLQGGDVVVVLTGRNVDQKVIDRVLST
jgi:threonine dehydratase